MAWSFRRCPILWLILTLAACKDDTVDSSSGYHPPGWSAPEVHGQAAKMHDETCTDCHGADLTGAGDAASCDACHPSDWREDCTFCHGGDGQPLPGESFDDTLEGERFAAHSAHLTQGDIGHLAYECEACHAVPEALLDAGHIFDDTPGRADATFPESLSPEAVHSAESNGCSNVYCHGDGQAANGSVSLDDSVQCGDCHGAPPNASGLSGEHREHTRHNVDCVECHGATVNAQDEISGPDAHVNGSVEIEISEPGVTWNGSTCSGSCHGEGHNNERW